MGLESGFLLKFFTQYMYLDNPCTRHTFIQISMCTCTISQKQISLICDKSADVVST